MYKDVFIKHKVKGSETRYRVNEAHDADIGQNTVKQYSLQPNGHFVLSVREDSDGSKSVELMLDKELDREKQRDLDFMLIAVDGGNPQRSGTANIHVTVLDANDNAPVFDRAVYKAISASDADEGVNGEVTYEFSRISERAKKIFSLDSKTGAITVTGALDFESNSKYEMRIDAKDGYGLSSDSKVMIDITDVNDNAPVIYLKSLTNAIPENVSPGSEVGIINVQDRDSESNGQVRCSIQQNVPFKLSSPLIRDFSPLVSTAERSGHSGTFLNLTA
uniref:Cadherin domain-containing protein n=1 Tax=Scophthalmus maximus TaxID=52904 RepID=A0A8D3CRH8_SCOMX